MLSHYIVCWIYEIKKMAGTEHRTISQYNTFHFTTLYIITLRLYYINNQIEKLAPIGRARAH